MLSNLSGYSDEEKVKVISSCRKASSKERNHKNKGEQCRDKSKGEGGAKSNDGRIFTLVSTSK